MRIITTVLIGVVLLGCACNSPDPEFDRAGLEEAEDLTESLANDLLAFSVANGVIPAALADQLLLVVALSMLLTPLLFILYDKVIAPRYAGAQAREADDIDEDGSIIIAGVGRFGGVINRARFGTLVNRHAAHQKPDAVPGFDLE